MLEPWLTVVTGEYTKPSLVVTVQAPAERKAHADADADADAEGSNRGEQGKWRPRHARVMESE